MIAALGKVLRILVIHGVIKVEGLPFFLSPLGRRECDTVGETRWGAGGIVCKGSKGAIPVVND